MRVVGSSLIYLPGDINQIINPQILGWAGKDEASSQTPNFIVLLKIKPCISYGNEMHNAAVAAALLLKQVKLINQKRSFKKYLYPPAIIGSRRGAYVEKTTGKPVAVAAAIASK